MPTILTGRAASYAALVAVATLALTSCTDDKDGTGSSPAPPPATADQTHSTGSGTHRDNALSKSAFNERMNKECRTIKGKVEALPQPSSMDDYDNLHATAKITLALYPPYTTLATTLIARTADATELTTKWLSIEKRDFNATKPLLTALIQATESRDAASVHSLVAQLQAAPDHSARIAAFMRGYGLDDCAALQVL